IPKRFTDILYVADISNGKVRRTRLPERGVWAGTFAADGNVFWVAGSKLTGVHAETLAQTSAAAKRFLCLAPRTDGGLVAGTADGHVAWLDPACQIERDVTITGDLAPTDVAAMM